MLQQWEADALVAAEKVYSFGTSVSLSVGTDIDYQVEAVDGTAFFLLDVRRSARDPRACTYQLRYQRDIVLARLCVARSHTNPDQERIDAPHLHRYREGDSDRWATPLEPSTPEELLKLFCGLIGLPEPDIQGGVV